VEWVPLGSAMVGALLPTLLRLLAIAIDLSNKLSNAANPEKG